jgi:hypothetical protein
MNAQEISMMADPAAEDLGVSIKKCTEFIAAVHSETQVLLMEASGVIEGHDYESVKGTGIQVSETSTKNIQVPGGWCHRVVARLFGDGGKKGKSKRIVAIEAHFVPSFELDRAALALGYARFEDDHDREALQNGYQSFMAGVFDEEGFEANVVKKRVQVPEGAPFSDATEFRVIAWELVSLNSQEKVKETITKGLQALGAIE